MDILEHLKIVNQADLRQKGKIKHQLHEIIGIAFFALLANAQDFEDTEAFAEHHLQQLKTIFTLKHGVPSHDTIRRAFIMLDPLYLQKFQHRFNELLNNSEGEKLKKIFAIDGKTQKGNQSQTHKPNHIVSAVDENGYCLGQELVDEKSNEITAIPELLDNLNVGGHIVTLDAMGTQREIARKIRRKKADYVLALKANQKMLHLEASLCFDDPEFLANCQYCKTVEKARGALEVREYWQSDDVSSLLGRRDWAGLQSIAMTKNTITNKDGTTSVQVRYFVSSLSLDVNEVARAVRGHWMVESVHWHLDVTFREDMDHTLDEFAAYNLNILRKLALNVLKLVDVGKKHTSLRKKRYIISFDLTKYLQQLLTV
jgi:predicted transposase YbfD/YdcC